MRLPRSIRLHLTLSGRTPCGPSTQTQALSALPFLYREVPALPVGWVDDVERAKQPGGCPTFRHCFATHMTESGYDIRTAQELLRHAGVETPRSSTHVLNQGGRGVKSPLGED